MKVEKFYLFFPPKLASFTRGETEYGIGAIPLGGFVKITGMNPDEEMPAEDAHRGYYAQPVWKRIVVIAAGPFVNVVIAFVILFFLAFEVARPSPDESVVGVDRERIAGGQRPASPATRSSPWTACAATASELREQIGTHDCVGSRDATTASRATRSTSSSLATGARSPSTIRPRYDPELQRLVLGFVRGPTARPEPARGRRSARVDFMWRGHNERLSA